MRRLLELTCRNIPRTAGLERLVHEQVARLDKVCHYLASCRVSIEREQAHQRSGSPYRVRVDMRLPPQQELVVTREPGQGNLHDPVSVVVRRAFDGARRSLKRNVERHRTPQHPKPETLTPITGVEPMSLSLASTAFDNEGTLPIHYTRAGAAASPPLVWYGVPDQAESLAVVVSTQGNGAAGRTHWLIYGIPPTVHGVAEDFDPHVAAVGVGINDYGSSDYAGPDPARDDIIRYTLYALDTSLAGLGRPTRQDFEQAIEGHVVASAELVATCDLPQ